MRKISDFPAARKTSEASLSVVERAEGFLAVAVIIRSSITSTELPTHYTGAGTIPMGNGVTH
jgi:hypothetical protein